MDPLTLLAAVAMFSLLGTLIGALAGLVPGLHINNVAYLISASAGTFIGLALALFGWLGAGDAEALLLVAALIVACLVAHTFTSILPSVFLGAPDPGRALSVLPAHRLLLRGRGREAVLCLLVGCVGGLATCLAILPLFRVLMGDPVSAYDKLRPFMAFIVGIVILLLVMSEPADRGDGTGDSGTKKKGDRCVLVLERVRAAELVLVEPPPDLAAPIRPYQAPMFMGRRVSVSGIVSEKREYLGNASFVIQEAGALTVLAPPGSGDDARNIRVGQIVIAEGHIAPRLERSWGIRRKLLASVLFLASGFLGILALSSGRLTAQNWYPLGAPPVPSAVMMFPLFCGLFGLPTLLLGLFEHTARAPQTETVTPVSTKEMVRGILSGTLAGGVIGWYPGMTSAHGSVLAKLVVGNKDPECEHEGDGLESPERKDGGKDAGEWSEDGNGAAERNGEGNEAGKGKDAISQKGTEDDGSREFLISSSAVTMANAFFNLVALFVILKARNGALHMAREILGDGLEPWRPAEAVPAAFALLIFSAALAALLALPFTLALGKKLASLYDRVPYRKLLGAVVLLLFFLLLFFSGAAGVGVAAASLCLGLIPPLAGVRRVHLMGAILVPTLLLLTDTSTGVISLLGI